MPAVKSALLCTKRELFYEKNKAAFKEICRQVGAPVPQDYKISDELSSIELDAIEYPVVVKPVDQCGSKGVSYCNSREEVIQTYRKVREISESPEVIVEKKIEGREFAAYYALAEGEASLLFLHTELAADKEHAGSCFVASTATDCVEDYVTKINDKVIEVLKRCGCRDNAAWVQLKQDGKGDFYVFELGYRLGADLAPFEYSRIGEVDLAKWSVECALGVKHTVEDLPKGLEHPMQAYAYSYMLCCGKSGKVKEIRGVQELKKNKNFDVILDICVGDELTAGGKEIGCIGFYAYTLNEVFRFIEEINEKIQIISEKDENMIFPYMNVQRFKEESCYD